MLHIIILEVGILLTLVTTYNHKKVDETHFQKLRQTVAMKNIGIWIHILRGGGVLFVE